MTWGRKTPDQRAELSLWQLESLEQHTAGRLDMPEQRRQSLQCCPPQGVMQGGTQHSEHKESESVRLEKTIRSNQ